MMSTKISSLDLLSLDCSALQKRLEAGLFSSVDLIQACLAQIDKYDQHGARLNAMISVTPLQLLLERSAQLDHERKAGKIRSIFHGIPILIKDAIATGPKLELATTLGSLALEKSITPRSATVVEKLEDLGAIVLGKTNLNEFCNFKSDANSNGWSAVGGQTQSAYIARKANETAMGQSDPCGSSTGSAVGVSAGYAPLALGTESIGSIVMPGTRAGLYAFKPALKSVNMDGVFRSSVDLDVVGGLARSTADLALLSQAVLTDEKTKELPKGGYMEFLTKNFHGLRIGFLDPTKWSLHPIIVQLDNETLKQMNDLYHDAIERIKNHAGDDSVVIPVDLPPVADLWYEGQNPIDVVMGFEGKKALEDWLEYVRVPGIATIEDLIKFNDDHREQELPEGHADQNQLLKASRKPPTKETYESVKSHMKQIAKEDGIDKLFRSQDLNILAFPMDSPMTFMSAASGYPIATMPAGIVAKDGRPYGVGIMAQAGNENLMFQFMSAYENYAPSRPLPSRLTTETTNAHL